MIGRTQMTSRGTPWLAPAVALVAAMAAAGAATLNSNATIINLLREGGQIETASAVLHFTAAAVALSLWPRARGIFGLIAVCAILMGARELDLHHAFTTHGLFSSKQYFRDTVPMSEKLLGGAAALTLLTLVATRLAASIPDIRRLLASRSGAVIGLLTIVVAVPLLMFLDAAPRMVREAGLAPSSDQVAYLLAFEELGELVLPGIVLLVTIQMARALDPLRTRFSGAPFATHTVTYMGSERRFTR